MSPRGWRAATARGLESGKALRGSWAQWSPWRALAGGNTLLLPSLNRLLGARVEAGQPQSVEASGEQQQGCGQLRGRRGTGATPGLGPSNGQVRGRSPRVDERWKREPGGGGRIYVQLRTAD